MLAAFDLDNTLVDRSAAIRRWAALLVEREKMSARELDAIVQADGDGAVPRGDFLRRLQALPGMTMESAELKDWYDATYSNCFVMDEGPIQALVMFRAAGWKVGVVTNGSKCRTEKKIAIAGLAPLVDALCVAEEVGVRKPNRGIFLETARRCDTDLSGWMIGDAPLEDIRGGAEAGLRTAWIRRGRRWKMKDSRPDIEVDSVLEAATRILDMSSDNTDGI